MLEPSEFWKSIPKKRMASGALFFNQKKELLIVKPAYKDHWSIPGGVVDANESPREACIREIKEEVGLTVSELRFSCVAYYRNLGAEKGESLQFMFYGGALNDDTVAHIALPKEEISEYKFAAVEKALPLLGKGLADRITACLKTLDEDKPLYLEWESSEP